MGVLTFFTIIYLLGGMYYAFYVNQEGIHPWYHFPINLLGGPIITLYIYWTTVVKKRKIPTDV